MAPKKVATNPPVGKYDPRERCERLELLFGCMQSMHAEADDRAREAYKIINSLLGDDQHWRLKMDFLDILSAHGAVRIKINEFKIAYREVMFNPSSFPQEKPSNPEQAPRRGRKPKDTPDTSWADTIEAVMQ